MLILDLMLTLSYGLLGLVPEVETILYQWEGQSKALVHHPRLN